MDMENMMMASGYYQSGLIPKMLLNLKEYASCNTAHIIPTYPMQGPDHQKSMDLHARMFGSHMKQWMSFTSSLIQYASRIYFAMYIHNSNNLQQDGGFILNITFLLFSRLVVVSWLTPASPARQAQALKWNNAIKVWWVQHTSKQMKQLLSNQRLANL